MSEIYRQTWAEVNLDNLVDNYQNIKLLMGNKTIIPVIKANAYGHGDIKVMERLYKEGVRICAVSLLEEAIKIRKRFPDIIIIMLGPVLENDLKVCSSKEIDITIYNQEIYNLIINFEGKLNCQFKVDTGMSRYGIKDFDLVVRMVNTLMSKTNINLRGIYTHFATAEDNKEFYNKQVKMMQLVLSKLKKVPSMVHMSNSASILQYEKDFDFTTHVRLGISLYGSLPIVSEFKLKPVMKLYSKIVQIKKLTQGDSLGYGITYRPKKDVYIAIIPIGYADGLWKAYKRGYVEIKGKKYKIVGTICMGACFIKVNEEIKVGDIVTIFGGLISIEEMGLILKTNSYEVLTAISYRVPRVYREEKNKMIKVNSEIGKLKSILLHRPGKELENLTPDLLEKLLFDDIPYLKVAQEEHDVFAETLRNEGVEVLYVTEMAAEALEAHPEIIADFINVFIEESNIKSNSIKLKLFQYLTNLTPKEMIYKMIEGVKKQEIILGKKGSIIDMLEDEYPFYTDPMPNILFQRDPFSSLGNGVAISRMHTDARQRETILSEYILKYHPRFYNKNPNFYYERLNKYSVEGGDILVLNKNVIAIGISSRTDPRGIEKLAEKIFSDDTDFNTILAFNIPKIRAFMHLDTVFTQVNYGIFTIHPEIEKVLTVFEIEKTGIGTFNITKVIEPLEMILSKHLEREVSLIRCGGKDIITSIREQWNDGANTLAISPGKVIVYDRNYVTNRLLTEAGIQVLEIKSSELSRGRGGPRCMAMPLEREEI